MNNVGISVAMTGPVNELLRGQKESSGVPPLQPYRRWLYGYMDHIAASHKCSSSSAQPLNDGLEVPRGRNCVSFTIVPLAPSTMSGT